MLLRADWLMSRAVANEMVGYNSTPRPKCNTSHNHYSIKWYSSIYQANGQVTHVNVARWSSNAGRTDAEAIDTRSTIMAHFVLAQVDGAVSVDEARRTAAQPSAVTSPSVTTRVVVAAVRCAAGATDVSWWTRAAVTGDQVRAGSTIKTWLWHALIYVDFTVTPCVRNQ